MILCAGVLGGSLLVFKAVVQQSPASQVRLQALCNAGPLQQKWHLEIALQLPNIPFTQGPAA